jgi:hypothetical protein
MFYINVPSTSIFISKLGMCSQTIKIEKFTGPNKVLLVLGWRTTPELIVRTELMLNRGGH